MGKKITKREHLKRHKELHKALDELVADFILCTDKRPSTSTVMELMEWAHQQTQKPDEPKS